jgi:hydrogenase maturation protein HypF
MNQSAYRILINGIVQGVGFRPFVYSLAIRYHLAGWVRNTSSGVEIEVCGPADQLDEFITSIKKEAPPLSRIESLQQESIQVYGYEGFQIQGSHAVEGDYQSISPDVSICEDCLRELLTPTDFRYRYPFINCTNCGPRFTIIKDIPYDRAKTTMADFELCSTCREEYEDPLDRRFHAQPVACPECGPGIWLEQPGEPNIEHIYGDQALQVTQQLLGKGKIAAIKGLGGFHLACDAENPAALAALRERKNRPAKPLAVMMPDLDTIRKYCQLSDEEAALLTSPQRPILLLDENPDHPLPESIAPGQNTLGVMLPYTPLHYLLFSSQDRFPQAPYQVLVMTSANFRGNPILTKNEEVRDQLGDIADFYIFHNREIHIHCDDSVIRVARLQGNDNSRSFPIRRSRGYGPQPLFTPLHGPSVLAVGAELKNTFCHTRENKAFLSQHLGDLKNLQTFTSFEQSIKHFEILFRIEPSLLVQDLHPDYLSTRYVIERSHRENLPTLEVQHHHAHIASCLADNNDPGYEPVIGMAFDGTGYGDDGAIWGGEVLLADYKSYQRIGQLDYFPLPGGDLAIKEPWRIGLALLHHLGIPWDPTIPVVAYAQSLEEGLPGVKLIDVLQNQLTTHTNTPLTSSLGRLFDGVASLLGIRQTISYEGQAAIELEALADPDETGTYPLEISSENIINLSSLVSGLLKDFQLGVKIPTLSARFHNTLATLVVELAQLARQSYSLDRVALSGGVWQNMNLLTQSAHNLSRAGFQVLTHQHILPNDGGVSLGQAVVGLQVLSVED